MSSPEDQNEIDAPFIDIAAQLAATDEKMNLIARAEMAERALEAMFATVLIRKPIAFWEQFSLNAAAVDDHGCDDAATWLWAFVDEVASMVNHWFEQKGMM